MLERELAVDAALGHDLVDATGDWNDVGGTGGVFGVRGMSVGGTDKQADFAARGFLANGRDEILEVQALKFLKDLCELAGEDGWTVSENLESVFERIEQPVRGLVKGQRTRLGLEGAEGFAAFRGSRGKKADEGELFGGQAGGGERGNKGRRSRHRNDFNVVAQAESDEAMARVGNAGSTGVADERDFGALLELNDDFGRASDFIVFVIAEKALLKIEMREKLLRLAGVFAGDEVCVFENAKGTEGNVFEIADRSGDYEQATFRRID